MKKSTDEHYDQDAHKRMLGKLEKAVTEFCDETQLGYFTAMCNVMTWATINIRVNMNMSPLQIALLMGDVMRITEEDLNNDNYNVVGTYQDPEGNGVNMSTLDDLLAQNKNKS